MSSPDLLPSLGRPDRHYHLQYRLSSDQEEHLEGKEAMIHSIPMR